MNLPPAIKPNWRERFWNWLVPDPASCEVRMLIRAEADKMRADAALVLAEAERVKAETARIRAKAKLIEKHIAKKRKTQRKLIATWKPSLTVLGKNNRQERHEFIIALEEDQSGNRSWRVDTKMVDERLVWADDRDLQRLRAEYLYQKFVAAWVDGGITSKRLRDTAPTPDFVFPMVENTMLVDIHTR